MDKIIVAIGGGEIRAKTTKKIDEYIAGLAKERAAARANALFVPTASHDSLPYFNSFRKIYTSDFDMKADVALLTKKDIPLEKIAEKVSKADLIYVGGGDTVYMLDIFRKTGMDKLILDAYNRGVIIAGLSAGAICWFEKFYSDSEIMNGVSGEYKIYDGLGVLDGLISPHYDERKEDFKKLVYLNRTRAFAVESDAAVVMINGKFDRALSSGGFAYMLDATDGGLFEERL